MTFDRHLYSPTMSDISKYFKSKKTNSIENSFILQCQQEEEEETKPPNEWENEKMLLERKIETLQIEKREVLKKYENLKTKHMQLLQLLFKLEKKNQDLEASVICERNTVHEFEQTGNSRPHDITTPSNTDSLVELVNRFLYVKHISISSMVILFRYFPYFHRTTFAMKTMRKNFS